MILLYFQWLEPKLSCFPISSPLTRLNCDVILGFGFGVPIFLGFLFLFLLRVPGMLYLVIWRFIGLVFAGLVACSYPTFCCNPYVNKKFSFWRFTFVVVEGIDFLIFSMIPQSIHQMKTISMGLTPVLHCDSLSLSFSLSPLISSHN